MGNPTGFLEIGRINFERRPVGERIHDWKEVYKEFPEDKLKAQASQVNITPLAENFGYMGMLLRRAGGHQTKVRGLHELLAGAKINFEGACREASTPATPEVEEEEKEVSP